MTESHKAKEQGRAEQDGGSLVITSHESLGMENFPFVEIKVNLF